MALIASAARRAKTRGSALSDFTARAASETARKRTFAAMLELTAQEAQVLRLAREGLSNPEIGGRLFLSSRTVLYHL